MADPVLQARYRAALCSMAPAARTVFSMHRIQDRSIVEIATELARPHREIEDLLAEAIVHIDRALGQPLADD